MIPRHRELARQKGRVNDVISGGRGAEGGISAMRNNVAYEAKGGATRPLVNRASKRRRNAAPNSLVKRAGHPAILVLGESDLSWVGKGALLTLAQRAKRPSGTEQGKERCGVTLGVWGGLQEGEGKRLRVETTETLGEEHESSTGVARAKRNDTLFKPSSARKKG